MKLERRRHGSVAENAECGGMHPLFVAEALWGIPWHSPSPCGNRPDFRQAMDIVRSCGQMAASTKRGPDAFPDLRHPCLETAFPRIPRFLSAFRVQKKKTAPFPMDDAIHEQKNRLTFNRTVVFGGHKESPGSYPPNSCGEIRKNPDLSYRLQTNHQQNCRGSAGIVLVQS